MVKRLLALLFFAQSLALYPCSIFKYVADGQVFFCGNEDWSATDPALTTIPPVGGKYGLVLLGWKSYLPRYPQAGVNSEGLSFDWATVPPQRYSATPGKENLDIDSTIEILKTCKNVDEVIAIIGKRNFSHLAEEHLIFADRTGKSCVFEYTKGSLKVIQDTSRAQHITNFNLSDKESGWYPCERYARLERSLKDKTVRADRLPEILNAVHQEGTYPTIYSYIFNLTSNEITLFHKHDYSKYQKFDVGTLIAQRRTIRIGVGN
jgi:hypothetical protein